MVCIRMNRICFGQNWNIMKHNSSTYRGIYNCTSLGQTSKTLYNTYLEHITYFIWVHSTAQDSIMGAHGLRLMCSFFRLNYNSIKPVMFFIQQIVALEIWTLILIVNWLYFVLWRLATAIKTISRVHVLTLK